MFEIFQSLGEGGFIITLGGYAFITSSTCFSSGEDGKSSDASFITSLMCSSAGVTCSSIGTSLMIYDINTDGVVKNVQNLDTTNQYIQTLSEDELRELREGLTEFIEFDDEIDSEVRGNVKNKTL
ncbi:MAG: hypothetical protein IKG27_01155 [Bacilli bacterium]|nr:hypothetical protein [Bacilli bacterium]